MEVKKDLCGTDGGKEVGKCPEGDDPESVRGENGITWSNGEVRTGQVRARLFYSLWLSEFLESVRSDLSLPLVQSFMQFKNVSISPSSPARAGSQAPDP